MDDPGTTWLILFLLGFVTDIIYTLTVKAIGQNKSILAAVGNMILSLIGFVSVWLVINDKAVFEALFYIIGCGIGTLVSMSLMTHKPEKKKVKKSILPLHRGVKKPNKSKKNHK